jgi:hypothetical protein
VDRAKGGRRAAQSKREAFSDDVERMTKREVLAVGYRRGYKKARAVYHYSAFMRELRVQLAAHQTSAASGGSQTT